MLKRQIMADIELMFFCQPEVGAKKIGHRAVAEPFAMQPQFAPSSDQSVGRENLQNLIPPRSPSIWRQAIGPEPIELNLLPQLPASQHSPHCRGR
jgi:hypothetical protein